MPPRTMGEDQPMPPIAVFHLTFSVLLQDSRCPDSLFSTLVVPAPRNCGRLAAAPRTASAAEASETPASQHLFTIIQNLATVGRSKCSVTRFWARGGPSAPAVSLASRDKTPQGA